MDERVNKLIFYLLVAIIFCGGIYFLAQVNPRAGLVLLSVAGLKIIARVCYTRLGSVTLARLLGFIGVVLLLDGLLILVSPLQNWEKVGLLNICILLTGLIIDIRSAHETRSKTVIVECTESDV